MIRLAREELRVVGPGETLIEGEELSLVLVEVLADRLVAEAVGPGAFGRRAWLYPAAPGEENPPIQWLVPRQPPTPKILQPNFFELPDLGLATAGAGRARSRPPPDGEPSRNPTVDAEREEPPP